jgi:DNA-binding NtrC family response regulator
VRAISLAAYHLLIRNRWSGTCANSERHQRASRVQDGRHRPGTADRFGRHAVGGRVHDSAAAHLAEIEKVAIVQTLMRTNWNKQEAAQILGLYRPTLYSKMKKHQILDQRAKPRTVPPVPRAPRTTQHGRRAGS